MRARNVNAIEGIPFTQYLMPDGEKVEVWYAGERDTEMCEKAQQIIDALFRFEAEMLPDMATISFTISDDFGDYACEIAQNGPSVPMYVRQLIMSFDIAAALEQRKKNV